MGIRGPAPKRSDERRRVNSPEADTVPSTARSTVDVPRLPTKMHRLARDWYRSLEQSPQSVYFTASDWQAALLLAHELTDHLTLHKISADGVDQGRRQDAAMFRAIWSGMSDLLTTEGARRRLQVEVERSAAATEIDDSAATSLDEYRAKLTG